MTLRRAALSLAITSCALTVEGPGASPRIPRDLAVGENTVCRVDAEGALWCWGANDWGQVRPDARTHVEPTPRRYPGLGPVSRVALARDHACVVRADGRVACWGDNQQGQLGDGTAVNRYAPVPVDGISDIEEVVLSPSASCARGRDGRWWCWGMNDAVPTFRGHAGTLVGAAAPGAVTAPREALRLAGVTGLSLGSIVGAAVRGGAVLRWGYRQDARGSRWVEPVALPGVTDATEVRAGYLTSCALRRGGGAWCWNAFNEDPVPVPGLTRATALAGFENDYCARRDDGTVACWSVTAMAGAPVTATRATALDGAAGVRRFEGSHRWNGCFIADNGSLRCRGRNLWGQLGDGAAVTTPEPAEVPGLDGVTQLSAGCESGACVASQDVSVCARTRDGAVWCWGGMDDEAPETVSVDRSRPTPVEGIRGVVELRVPCALTAAGISCWDATRWGRRVRGDAAPSTPLRRVEGMPEYPRRFSTSRRGRCGCGVLGDGALWCWDHTNDVIRAAERVPELSDVTDVALTWNGACVRTLGGEVRCRLLRDGEGCGLTGAWTPVAALRGAQALFVDGSFWCGRDPQQGWRCAHNGFDPAGGASPLPIARVADAGEIVAGSIRVCGVVAGAVRCVGRNEYGALGTNLATADDATPLRDEVTSLSGAGPYGACAVRRGKVYCWGLNSDAELGNGRWNYDRGFIEVR